MELCKLEVALIMIAGFGEFEASLRPSKAAEATAV